MNRFLLFPFILLLLHDYLVFLDLREKNIPVFNVAVKMCADFFVTVVGSVFFSVLFNHLGLSNYYFCFFLVYLLIAVVDYLILKHASFLTLIIHQLLLFFCVVFIFFLSSIAWA